MGITIKDFLLKITDGNIPDKEYCTMEDKTDNEEPNNLALTGWLRGGIDKERMLKLKKEIELRHKA
jgi:hypothetical protein